MQAYSGWGSHVQEPMVVTELLTSARDRHAPKPSMPAGRGTFAVRTSMNRLQDNRHPTPVPSTPVPALPSIPQARDSAPLRHQVLYWLPMDEGRFLKGKEEWSLSNNSVWCLMESEHGGASVWCQEHQLRRIPLPAQAGSPPRPWLSTGAVKREPLPGVKQEPSGQSRPVGGKKLSSGVIELDSD